MNIKQLQKDSLAWAVAAFGEQVRNRDERAARLVEEAIEVAQVEGVSLGTIIKIAHRVYSRPVGVLEQEIGGVAITTLSLCENAGIDFEAEAQREFDRVTSIPSERWVQKHREKIAAGTSLLVSCAHGQVPDEVKRAMDQAETPALPKFDDESDRTVRNDS